MCANVANVANVANHREAVGFSYDIDASALPLPVVVASCVSHTLSNIGYIGYIGYIGTLRCFRFGWVAINGGKHGCSN